VTRRAIDAGYHRYLLRGGPAFGPAAVKANVAMRVLIASAFADEAKLDACCGCNFRVYNLLRKC
jgi:hypothetical protein